MVGTIFISLSVGAIVAGGCISAFTARNPTWSKAWASAYLVLVVGIIQFALVAAWQRLDEPESGVVFGALLAFNVANAGVIAGTVYKRRLRYYRVLVNGGGLLIAAAMALLLYATRNSTASFVHVEFILLTTIILISMPIGLLLSNKRHKYIR